MPNEERRPPGQDEAPQVQPDAGPTEDENIAREPAGIHAEPGPVRPVTCDVAVAKMFLDCVFAELVGFIEVRLIEDRKGGAVVDRRWYGSVQELFDDLRRLCGISVARHAAVFYGVLPRRERGKGAAEDVLAGLVVWVDLDFKAYAGGEAEAQRRLTEFPIKPSIVVRSGHGLHAYWLLREPAEPAELSSLSHRLAKVLGGDHAFDAARVLRLPGTANRKDPEHPIPVVIEAIEPERRVNPTEIADTLEMLGADDAAPKADLTKDKIEGPLHPKLLVLVQRVQRLKSLYEGRGKPELNDDGKPLDTTSSGYDYSLVLALAARGILDPVLLGNALWNRPDQAAQAKGMAYIERTVERALARFEELESLSKEDVQIDFVVDRIRVFSSVPPVYEFTIEGKTLHLTTPQLLSHDSFTVAFVNVLRRVPALPKRWADQVNVWLAQAEIVEQPPEASEEPAFRDAVQRAVDNMPVGEEAGDLDHGKAVLLDDGSTRAFKPDAVLKLLIEDWKCAKRNDLCRVLRDLGFDTGPRKVGKDKTQVRVWFRRASA